MNRVVLLSVFDDLKLVLAMNHDFRTDPNRVGNIHSLTSRNNMKIKCYPIEYLFVFILLLLKRTLEFA